MNLSIIFSLGRYLLTKSTKNFMLRLFIILGFLLIVYSLFYIFVLDTTLKNEANRISFEKHQVAYEVLSDRISVLSESYSEGTLSWPTKDYDPSILLVDNISNYEITRLSDVFSDETSTVTYLILKHPTLNQVMYRPFNEVLIVVGLSFGDTGVILNSNGIIKYHTNDNVNNTNLFGSSYFPTSVYSQLDTKLNENEFGFLNYKLDSKTYVLSYSKIENNYIYLSVDDQYDYLELFVPVIWSYLALGLLMLASFVVFSLMVVKRRFDDDVVFEKITKTLRSDLIMIEAGGLGQIRKMNKLFTNLTKHHEIKLLTDLTSEKLDMPTILKTNKPFYMDCDKLEPKVSVRFLINKYARNYQLIGEIIDSTSNVLDKYKDLALTHPDSGLKNKLALEEMIETLDRKDRFSLIVMGIKSFDEISKSIGRQKSQEVNKVLIELLQSKMYPNMYLFHIEKHEFVILQQKDVNYDVTVGWAKQMMELVDTKILLPDLPVKLELLVGIVHNKGTITNAPSKDILEAIDVTYERAIVSTTNNLMIYTERYMDFRNRANQLEIDIRKGIENDEFQMYMQPQYDLHEKRVVGFELLLRWHNPKYIKESPATYIRQAEKSNLIIDLGRVINDKVFRIAKSLEGMDIDVSFNISPRQLLQPGFINELIALKDKYQVDPSRIAIELTETLLILQMDVIVEKFNALKELNFKIQLDDFGTGYSSLNYLKRLPIDNIKIDKLFVDEIETSSKARQILKTMIALGKNLKMGVIIEGVETDKQVEQIRKESMAIIQGFYVSQALPEKEAFEFIKKKVNL